MAVSPAESGILGDYLAWVAVYYYYIVDQPSRNTWRGIFSPLASWESYRRCHHVEQIVHKTKTKQDKSTKFHDATFSCSL